MRSQVLQLKLHHIVRRACSVLIITLVSISGKLLAEQPQDTRLFHEPMNIVEADQTLSNIKQSPVKLSDFWQSKNQRGLQKTTDKSPRTEISLVDNASSGKSSGKSREKKLAFQYNGFIATTSGRHYLINGLPLSGIDSLILVSVKYGGRSIVLKTPKGQTFELSVGQTVGEDSQ